MDINELRDLLRVKTTRVTKKISRVKSSSGAIISGTELDPRVNRASIAKMNRRQINRALGKADKFLSRGTQFVGLGDNTPVPRSEWNKFERLRQKQNDIINAHYQQVKDVRMPNSAMTVGQNRAMRTPTSHPQAGNPSVNVDVAVPKTAPSGVANEQAFQKLMKDARRKSTKKYHSEFLQTARSTFDSISENSTPAMNTRVKKLSNDQFLALWNIKGFVDTQSLIYEMIKDAGGYDNLSETQHQIINDGQEDIERYVTWAENLRFGKRL